MKRPTTFDRNLLTLMLSVAAMAVFALWAFLKFSK
jgi:hypothetical protein